MRVRQCVISVALIASVAVAVWSVIDGVRRVAAHAPLSSTVSAFIFVLPSVLLAVGCLTALRRNRGISPLFGFTVAAVLLLLALVIK